MKRLTICMAIATMLFCSGATADAQDSRRQQPQVRKKTGNRVNPGKFSRGLGYQRARSSRGRQVANRLGQRSRFTTRSPNDFLVDGTRVHAQVRDTNNSAHVRLGLAASGTWMKAIVVIDKDGREHKVQQQGLDGSYLNNRKYVDIPVDRLGREFKVHFWAAKFLGVSTHLTAPIYKTNNLRGKQITFTWLQDESDDFDRASGKEPINQTVEVGGKGVKIESREGGTDGYLTIEFDTNIDWYSGIAFRNRVGVELKIEREHGTGDYFVNGTRVKRHEARLRVPLTSLNPQVKFDFWQAKGLGVRTFMKDIKIENGRFDGRIVKFTWRK